MRSTAQAWGKKSGFYKPLPTRFRRDGFDYRQIYREGDFAIYQQTWNRNEDSAALELIRLRRREGFQIGGRFVESAEVYPRSEAWGMDGFTFTDKDAAFRKLRGIVESSSAARTFRSKEMLAALKKSPT
jgi:hypothetical protein